MLRGLALALVVAASCRGDGRGANIARDAAAVDAVALCERLCALRDQVACGRALPGCVDACAASLGGPCGAPWALAYRCAIEHGVSDYFCDDRGQPQLKEGACGETFVAVRQCVAAAR